MSFPPPVDENQLGRLFAQEWQQRATRCSSSAEHQDAAAGHFDAEIDGDVTHEANPVEILGHDPIALEFQAVYGARSFGALRKLVCVGEGIELERGGDVQPPGALGPELINPFVEAIEGCLDRLIDKVLSRHLGESTMDEG